MKPPHKLKLLPGLKWKGHLTILSATPTGFVVQFDAEIVDPNVQFRYVYDRATLTPSQFCDWTGHKDAP